ncbi:NAD-dependent epimerase/dehydratase family protein [Bacteriovoracales bacterium]|nr:NAD-dependent epimerase/dehydratase family protein [Bacteriovoracales bacterium]
MEKAIVAVTGASGHLGNNFIRLLLAENYSVRVLVLPGCKVGGSSLKGLDVQIFIGSVLQKETLTGFINGADFVVHLAGVISIDGDKDGLVEKVNVEGTANVAEMALEMKVKRLVYMSSIHVYDFLQYDRPIDETFMEANIDTHGFYSYSKVLGEREVRKRVEKGLDAIILNPTGIIGPYDYEQSRMGRFFLDIYNNKLPSIISGGFHYIDVRDVAETIIKAMHKGKTNESYILSKGFYSMRELYEISNKITGLKIPLLEIPLGVAYLGIPFSKLVSLIKGEEALITEESLCTLNTNPFLSCEKAKRDLGFETRPIEETLEDIYYWFLENNFINIEKQDELKKEKLLGLKSRKKSA